MSWVELRSELELLKPAVFLPSDRSKLISFMDLTSLNETDTKESITIFCQKAVTPFGKVAALCIYPQFVETAAAFSQGKGLEVATVANFPQGEARLSAVLQEIESSIQAGATEIDVVFPYSAYLRGEGSQALSFIKECKAACQGVTLKVILETGALKDLRVIAEVTEAVVLAGADFVKTSTGKIAQGASLEAAAAILLTLKKMLPEVKRPLGFKAAGGVREPLDALSYLTLAQNIMGSDWVSPRTFRLGASLLLDKLLQEP
jgi:deoxyribose-phosphate aldolase